MSTVTDLLDRAKNAAGVDSDNAFAGAIGVKRQTVSNWRNGKAYPDAVTCNKLAHLTGEPLARVLGVVGEARALSKEEKQVWRRLATAAALAFLCVGLATPQAATAKAFRDSGYPSMPIM